MGKRSNKHSSKDRKQQKGKQQEDLEALKKRVEDFDLQTCDSVAKFEQLPISGPTLRGLKESAFVSTTDIQKKTIPLGLKGKDILAAAKTGSGKTLAFLIPMIETLIKNDWNELDGVGALVIAPTRELAIQIYEVLLKVGKYNSFSCGLVIGGKDFKFESERIARINILIGTPGRLLQHMDESSALDLSGLQMLILDEADRILDMGFKKTLDNIVLNLPPERQTLLFSATQTSSVEDLARLSLTNPEYVNCSSDDDVSTPDSLEQCYITVPLQEKLNVLWSFIKTHLNSKILVFVSSSKQVHFIYETFRKLQPGTSLMKLHGRQKQTSRIEATVKFSHAQHCCLFATDIVARGLDFPAIDWVIQLDCPEDASTYIHRVGRAARFGRSGKSLLMLTPSEEDGFVKRLESKKVTVNKLNIKGSKKKTISSQLQALCFQKPELKYLGQKAFISYFKSIYIKQDKEVFDIDAFPAEDYAKSLGLPGAPRIKLMEKSSKNQDSEKYLKRAKDLKNSARQLVNLQSKEEGDQKVRTKYDKMFERQNQSVLSKHYLNMTGVDNNSDDEEFMTVKKVDSEIKNEDIPELDNAPTSKRAAKRALSKKASAVTKGLAKKLVFDDDGNTHEIYELQDEDDFHKEGDARSQKEKFIDEESLAMLEADSKDKAIAKEKRQEKRRRRQELEKMALEESDGSEEEELEADIDRDYESEEEEPDRKKARWFDDKPVAEEEHDEITEIERPQSLEDLESLTAKLIRG